MCVTLDFGYYGTIRNRTKVSGKVEILHPMKVQGCKVTKTSAATLSQSLKAVPTQYKYKAGRREPKHSFFCRSMNFDS